MDGEAAQAQGLSDELVLYVAKIPELDPSIPRKDLDLLMMVLKTCSIHFERQVICWSNFFGTLHIYPRYRNIDKLPNSVSKETIARLKGFMGLKTAEEILEWHEFCKSSSNAAVLDWYQQKKDYPWLLPSLNRSLTKIDNESWDLTPNHTNLVETAHAATNAVTLIGKEILEAIIR
jgi:hypothetical protein